MKKSFKLFYAAALILAASCAKTELAEPEKTRISDGFVDVEFNAVLAEPTKATLTPNEEETTFTPGWENGDAIKVYYSANSNTDTADATWNASSHSFTASLPEYKGAWDYKACYPAFDANRQVAFGSSRTQNGNKFNSAYDIMTATASATNADAGKDNDGNPIVFNFERETAIQYFHFTSTNTETIQKATLTIDGGTIANSDVTIIDNYGVKWGEETGSGTIEVTFTNAPSASDFQLWFNVKPTEYTSVILTVETETKTYTLCNITSGEYEAGKLYKVKKEDIVWDDKASSNTKKLLFSFKTHPTGWPVGSGKATEGNYTYTLNSVDYTFSHTKSGNGIYCGGKSITSGYLMISKDEKLGLPAIQGYKLVSVKAVNSSGCSTSVKVSIQDEAGVGIEGGTEQTWSTTSSTYTYTLSDTEENTVYCLSVANKNCQLVTLVLSYEAATAKQEQTLSFPQEEYTVADNESFDAPTVTGAHTTVTYASSNTGVATVNASTGAVTIVAAGTTVITATAASDATYKKGTASYTLTVTPTEVLTTMDEIFAKATAVGSTATPVKITLGNWVVSGVKGSNAYVTDGTKGFIIYESGHGFAVGDKLSGTVECDIVLYNGSAEFKGLKSSTTGLSVTKGGTITPATIAIAALSGVNTGAVITFTSLTYDGTNEVFSDGTDTIKPFTSIMGTLPTLISGKDYKVTGVYVQFVKDNVTTKEIAPRTDGDFVLLSPYIAATASKTSIDAAGETITVTVDAQNVTSWTATSSDDTNFKVSNKTATSFDVTVTENTSTTNERSATITVSAEGADDAVIELTQDKAGDGSGFKGTLATWGNTTFTVSDNVTLSKNESDHCGKSAKLCAKSSNNVTTSLTAQTLGSGSLYVVYYEASASSYWEITLPITKKISVGTSIKISYNAAVNSNGITSWTAYCNGNKMGQDITINVNGSPSSLSDMTAVERSFTLTSDVNSGSDIVIKIQAASSGTKKNTRITNICVSAE